MASPGYLRSSSSPSAASSKSDLHSEAKSFSLSLSQVFLAKKRDTQSKHLLEKAQRLIDGLLAETSRPNRQAPPTPAARTGRGGANRAGGMGQLWEKLDELKRENDHLKRQRGRGQDEKAGSPKSPKTCKPHPGQQDSLTIELQKLTRENESLKTEVDKLTNSVKEYQIVTSQLQEECKRSKAALEAAQKSAKKAREETKKMETTLMTTSRTEKDSPKQKPAIPTKPNKGSPKSNGTTKMTASPKTTKVRTDNRLTETITDKCRPTNIALSYTTLESQEWMDVKEHLEENYDEEDVVRFLHSLLMISYEETHRVLKCVERVAAHICTNPVAAVEIVAKGLVTDESKLSDDISDAFCQYFRTNVDRVNLLTIDQSIKEKLNSSVCLSGWNDDLVQTYVTKCAFVTWQMAIQKPPMILIDRDTVFDDVKHKLWWSCDQSKARKIDYFIWPVLRDFEGGNVMVKGCVHAS